MEKVGKVLVIMMLTILLCLSFGSFGLYSWSLTLDGDVGFLLFYSPLKKIHTITSDYKFNTFVEKSRKEFQEFTQWEFPQDLVLLTHSPREVAAPVEVELPPEPLYKGETLDVLVVGDSLANSIGKQLGPLINERVDMTCRVEGVISSNLIRLDYYNWVSEAPRFADESEYDCVLIFLGANTMQSFYFDGKLASLFSDEWVRIYRARAEEMVSQLKDRDMDVYWMVLPPMQKESYDRNIKFLDGVISEVCQQNSVQRFSYSSLITNETGHYIGEKVVNDRQIRLRSDGIHFTSDGASYISQYLIEELRAQYEMPEVVEPSEEEPILEIPPEGEAISLETQR